MPYMICKKPEVQIDIMVLQKYWPLLASIIEQAGCSYRKEDWVEIVNGRNFVTIKDISAPSDRQLGDLLRMVYELESRGEPDDAPHKFYILLKTKWRKGKKHAGKVRKEVHPRSEGGDRGESAGDIQPGQNP